MNGHSGVVNCLSNAFPETVYHDMVSVINSTPGPLYNMLRYNTVLDITLITAGPQLVILDYFCYMSIHFTLFITWIGWLIRKLAWTRTIVLKRGCGVVVYSN